jgi:hypothetical protein
MHVKAPEPPDPKLPIFFNVTASVGNQAANANRDDILLVQFLLRAIAEAIPATLPGGQGRRDRMLKVPLSGVIDPATIDGIRAWQEGAKEQFPATVVDGRVSSARAYLYGGAMWTIVHMNAAFRAHFPTIWPRLQDHPRCPAPLRLRVPQVL